MIDHCSVLQPYDISNSCVFVLCLTSLHTKFIVKADCSLRFQKYSKWKGIIYFCTQVQQTQQAPPENKIVFGLRGYRPIDWSRGQQWRISPCCLWHQCPLLRFVARPCPCTTSMAPFCLHLCLIYGWKIWFCILLPNPLFLQQPCWVCWVWCEATSFLQPLTAVGLLTASVSIFRDGERGKLRELLSFPLSPSNLIVCLSIFSHVTSS